MSIQQGVALLNTKDYIENLVSLVRTSRKPILWRTPIHAGIPEDGPADMAAEYFD